MAVEFVAIQEFKTDGGTSIAMTAPVGTSVGDLLIAYISKDDNVAIYNTGSYGDWNMVFNNIANGQTCLYIAWKWAEAGDAAETKTVYTWNGDSEDWLGEILCYSGVKAVTPIHGTPGIQTGTSATPTAPSVAFEDLAVGSLVLQVMGIDSDDDDYVTPAQLTERFNAIQGNDIGGAGGDKANRWVLPTGFADPGTEWADEALAYDGDIGTDAEREGIPAETWSDYLELTCSALSCSKVRFYAYYNVDTINQISLDVYYSSGWHNIYEGAYAHYEWVEKAIGSTETVTAMRAKFYNADPTFPRKAFIHEANFWGIGEVKGTGETGTAVFTATSRPWAAATLIIEALGVAKQYLLSTVVITSSITGSLSRGVTEALTSTSAITTSMIGRLTRIVNLISTVPIVTSITSALSRGITQALTSTANGVVSITGSLSRGVTEALTSTANIVTSITATLTKLAGETQYLLSTAVITSSITSSLSRGITETLTSVTNITTSISGSLSRGITAGLTSTSNIAVSITASLSRGITQVLVSTANIATSIIAELSKIGAILLNSTVVITTSITGNLSRGITETLVSTVNIVTSFTGSLSRGIIAGLNSISNITVSITSSLSRGIKEALTSTANIAVSITAELNEGLVKLLNSTVVITTSVTSTLSRGITQSLASTVNIVSSIISNLTAIYHWIKMTKEVGDWTKSVKVVDDWTKVEKEKDDWAKVDRTERGWFGGPWFFDWFSGTFRGIWIKVSKEIADWTKVTKE